MRKILALLLMLGIIGSLGGCAGESTPAAAAAPATKTTEAAAEESTVPETRLETRPVPEENLFLTVSSITFSLVGESEDIYLGRIPREQVTWRSEDPSVVDVADGVLSAVGVGSTTIHASYEGRQVSCIAGCLAETREELDQLDPEILSAPKRLPPEVDLDAPCTCFDDSALLGDSIAYMLWQAESKNNYLGNMTFVSRHGVSVHSLVLHSKEMYFGGHEMHIEDIAERLNPSRIYLMLGCLDFQVPSSTAQLVENWELLLDRISGKAPDAQIVMISNIPCFTDKTEPVAFNTAVAEITPQLKQLAADKGYGYLDLGSYVQDHYGRMPQIYSYDKFHMNEEGSLVWIRLLRYYAQFEREGGRLA